MKKDLVSTLKRTLKERIIENLDLVSVNVSQWSFSRHTHEKMGNLICKCLAFLIFLCPLFVSLNEE